MLWAVLSAVLLQIPQAPPRDAAPPGERPAGTGMISGRVVGADGGAPIRRAAVTLSPVEPRSNPPRTVQADLNGRYAFTAVPAGAYRLCAAPGSNYAQYLASMHGASRRAAGRVIDLAAGQRLEEVDIALPRGGAIPGRVVDEFGDVVTRARVYGVRVAAAGTLFQRLGESTQTDDYGRFRLFGLEPGEYVVAAEAPLRGGIRLEHDREGFAPTYYPGAATEQEAARVRVAAGEDAAGIEIQLARTKVFRVSGVLVDSKGRPAAHQSVNLVRVPPSPGSNSRSVSFRDGGRFTIDDVPAGDYRLIATSEPMGFPTAGSAESDRVREYAALPLSVASDVEDLVVMLRPGVSVAGRTVFAEGTPATLPPIHISARPADRRGFGSISQATAVPDGVFTLSGLFGEKVVHAGAPGYALKAVILAGADITDTPIEFKPEHNTQLRLVLTSRTSTLEGVVSDEGGRPAEAAAVLLIPEHRSSWRFGSVRLRIAWVGKDGRFRATNVLEGRYHAVAVPGEDLHLSPDVGPDFFEALVRHATAVVVAENETRTVDLRLATRLAVVR